MSALQVFVYGTLKRGGHNHHLLEGDTFLGEHRTPPRYTMYSLGGFPAVVRHGNTAIQGEVYRISQQTFANLDRLEDYPSFYDRELIDTPYGKAWMYIMDDTLGEHPIVTSGNWRNS